MSIAPCISREQLESYLQGWNSPEQCDSIEKHLHECPLCEREATKIESESDWMISSLRVEPSPTPSTKPVPSPPPDSRSDDAQRADLKHVLDRAKSIMTEPQQSDLVSSETSVSSNLRDVRLGAYKLLQPLGQGGMGSVYLAEHVQLGKTLAVKVLSSRLARFQDVAGRFQRETRAAGGLDHPAIVRTTDAGQCDGIYYLAMEYIDGLDLSRLARAVGTLKIADACEIAKQVALGLSQAHARGIIHRDIKPSNVMLSRLGEVKILDFGLARLSMWDQSCAELTTVGQLIGTLDYMAPEQADRPEAVDYRADLYSLGAMLFRLLCGHAPLVAAPDMSPLAKLRLIATQDSPHLSTLRSDAPTELVELVRELLARQPDARPASAAIVAQRLEAFTAEADLKSLISDATEKDSSKISEPNEDGPTRSLSFKLPNPNTVNSFTSHTQAPPVAAGSKAVLDRKPPRKRLLVALGLAFAGLFAWGAITIYLETSKGRLVIESNVGGVQIQVTQNGREVESLNLSTGTNETRLHAGRYQVTIASPSDEITIEGDAIEIRSGKSTIARVRKSATEPSSISGQPQPSSTEPEPMFGGKPLSQWIDEFSRERSREGLEKALNALSSLAQDAPTAITAAVKKQLPRLIRNRLLTEGLNLLKVTAPDENYASVIVNEVLTKQPELGELVFSRLQAYNAPTSVSDSDTRPIGNEKLLEWISQVAFDANSSPSLKTSAAKYLLRQVITDETNPAEAERCLDLLLKQSWLDDDFWFAPSYDPYPSDSAIKKTRLPNIIRSRAIEMFRSGRASIATQVKATDQLRLLVQVHQDSPESQAIERDLTTELQNLIKKAITDETLRLGRAKTPSKNPFLVAANGGFPGRELITLRGPYGSRSISTPPNVIRGGGSSGPTQFMNYLQANVVYLLAQQKALEPVESELCELWRKYGVLAEDLEQQISTQIFQFDEREMLLTSRSFNPTDGPTPEQCAAMFVRSAIFETLSFQRKVELSIPTLRATAEKEARRVFESNKRPVTETLTAEEAAVPLVTPADYDKNSDGKYSFEELVEGLVAQELPNLETRLREEARVVSPNSTPWLNQSR